MNSIVFTQDLHSQWILSIYGDMFKGYNLVQIYEEEEIFDFHDNDIIFLGISFSPKLILNSENIKSKIVLLDVEGELWPYLNKNHDEYKRLLDVWLKNSNHYFISQRFHDYIHPNCVTGKLHYSLFYYFSRFELFFKQPIQIPSSSNASNEFITFLGKSKEMYDIRFNFLNKILNNNLNNCKYNHGDSNLLNDGYSENKLYFKDVYNIFWNILQSLNGKINIIFETLHLNFFEDYYSQSTLKSGFVTEKTLRALITPNPSILIVDTDVISYFKKIGFKFPYDGFNTLDEVSSFINNIKIIGIDKWVSDNKVFFEHNSKLLWKIMFDKDTNIENIINKLVKLK